jgi:hypothetical protein
VAMLELATAPAFAERISPLLTHESILIRGSTTYARLWRCCGSP